VNVVPAQEQKRGKYKKQALLAILSERHICLLNDTVLSSEAA
jgi:hypothetical protein